MHFQGKCMHFRKENARIFVGKMRVFSRKTLTHQGNFHFNKLDTSSITFSLLL